jgi:nitrogen fixation NifU-like protein
MKNKKEIEFDKFIQEIQEEINEEEEAIYSKKVIEEYNNPKNLGRMTDSDSFGKVKGTCGDTMEFYLKINNNRIGEITFMTDGCGTTVACGSILTTMVREKSLDDAMAITKDDLLKALDGLPDENLHCAALAVGTLRKAIKSYSMRKDEVMGIR